MDERKIVDLSGRRAENAKQRRKAALSGWMPTASLIAWGIFLAVVIAGFFWSGAASRFQKAAPVGVAEYAAPIGTCGWMRRTCLVDGDTGWQDGVKWRLTDVDAPEIGNAACARERDFAAKSLERLSALMAQGYKIAWSGRKDRFGRELVALTLPDGRDAGKALISEGLAQVWPNTGNIWCE